jgi:general secretion pathway protein A
MSDYGKIERIGLIDTPFAAGGQKGPVANARRPGGLTCEAFYGLREKPFALASDPRFFYLSQPHASAYEKVLGSIRRRESLCVLSGEIGTGKTTLCRAVLQSLDRQTFSAFVPDPFATREDLLKIVLMDFGVISIDDLTSGRLNGSTRTELSYLLYEFLHKLAPLQAFAVVVIDEAQNLSLPLLEEIRILSDSDGRERQLQVILIGQPELQEKLMLHEMRQVEQRISVRCNLEPLSRDGIAGYVAHRLKIAEGTPDRISFSADGIDLLHRASRGVPRLINRICDRALHHGHLRQAASLDSTIVRQAIDDIGLHCGANPAAVSPPVFPVSTPEPAAKPSETNLTRAELPRLEPPKAEPPKTEPSKAGPVAGASDETTPSETHECVDVWLTTLDAHPRSHHSLPPAPAVSSQPRAEESREWTIPQTYLQRVGRRWLRRFATILLWAAGLLAGGVLMLVGLTVVQYREVDGVVVMLPPPVAPPVTVGAAPKPLEPPIDPQPSAPETGTHVIHVALFTTEARALELVNRLEFAGLSAFRVPVGIDDRLRYQVVAGPYASLADADADLARLRESRDFEDARTVRVTPVAR